MNKYFLSKNERVCVCRSFFCVVLLSCSLGLVAGCTPKSSSVPAVSVEEQVPAVDAFALAVSRMQPGEQSVMTTSFGPESLVMVGGSYTSGLGQMCKKASVRAGGMSHRVAVCRDETGWFTAESVFEHTQR